MVIIKYNLRELTDEEVKALMKKARYNKDTLHEFLSTITKHQDSFSAKMYVKAKIHEKNGRATWTVYTRNIAMNGIKMASSSQFNGF